MRAGELIIALLGGANRDPAVFTNPQRFDVTRADAGKHLAFSAGTHFYIGAALAKMEGEVALRALFDRFPDLTLTMEPHRRPSQCPCVRACREITAPFELPWAMMW